MQGKNKPSLIRRENVRVIAPECWTVVGLKTYRSWCRLPYHGHPKGCTMWNNKKKHCKASFRKTHTLHDQFDVKQPAWVIWEEFDLGAHAARMKEAHPEWTEYQCRNVLYWQTAVKKKRNDRVKEWFRRKGLWGRYAGMTEGFCVNVYATLRHAGIILDPIKNIQKMKKLCFIIAYKEGSKAEAIQKKQGKQIIIY